MRLCRASCVGFAVALAVGIVAGSALASQSGEPGKKSGEPGERQPDAQLGSKANGKGPGLAPGQAKKEDSAGVDASADKGSKKDGTESELAEDESGVTVPTDDAAATPSRSEPKAGNGKVGNRVNQGKHTICHATGSASNPYVMITPAKSGVFNGHLGEGHQAGDDIIPPFQYDANRDGTFETYSQNWDAEGKAIFAAGCERSSDNGDPGGNPGDGDGSCADHGTCPGGGDDPGDPGDEDEGGSGGGGGVPDPPAGLGVVSNGELPFTGLPIWIPLLAGAGLLAAGLMLRHARGTS